MSIASYPSFKQSNASWFAEVPSHWEVVRLKNLFEIVKVIANSLEFDVLSVTQKGIKIKDIESNDGQLSMDYSKYQMVNPGDYVMNHMDLLTGYVDISKFQGVTSPDYRAFRLKNIGNNSRFYLYLLQNCYHQKLFFPFGQGSSQLGRWRLPTDSFNEFLFPLPPVAEQTAITEFLDRETAKIDALIEEQKRLIELLKEKRQAVISHAVTKGLDPSVKMKDSGIKWLGQVPKHWDVRKLGNHCKLQGGFAFASEDFEMEGIPVIRMNNLDRGRLSIDGAARISVSKVKSAVALNVGDLIWGMSGSIGETGSLGNFARVSETDVPCQLNQRVGRFLPDELIEIDFLEYLVQSSSFYDQILLYVTGTAQSNISSEQVQSCIVAIPPVLEQRQIVTFLKSALAQLQNLAFNAETATLLLYERRSALISAAVTGKIDVRGLA